MNTTQSCISSRIFEAKIQQNQPEHRRTQKTTNSDGNDKPWLIPRYKSVLVRFMSFLKEHEYAKDYEFSPEELGTVTPIDVKKYMCYRAYGTVEPGPDDQPLHVRSG
jgi:hypothetical protein